MTGMTTLGRFLSILLLFEAVKAFRGLGYPSKLLGQSAQHHVSARSRRTGLASSLRDNQPVATQPALRLSYEASRARRLFGGRTRAPEGVLTPGEAIQGLYDSFNEKNATAAASFLDENCIYEDLLLGPNTICRGREAFFNVLKFHPAFVTSAICSQLPFKDQMPTLTLVVDSIAEGVDCVGVEWHVEVGSGAFPLGRGLSQAKVDPATGKILRVVDIAEAPWRVIGLLLAPLASIFLVATEFFIMRY
jgi:hypothetical protein